MKVMVRFHDGWNYFDNVVECPRDLEDDWGDGFDTDALLYEAARYLPKDYIIPFEKMRAEATEFLGHPASDSETWHYFFDEYTNGSGAEAVYVDYLNAFCEMYYVDMRIQPPNAKLGPVRYESPDRERYTHRR